MVNSERIRHENNTKGAGKIMANKLTDIDNPAMQFISNASQETAPQYNSTADRQQTRLQPAKKNNREVRLNLLLPLTNKIKLQKLVERQGYKSVNDYINYLIARAVEHEAEPTAEEIVAYKEQAEARKKK